MHISISWEIVKMFDILILLFFSFSFLYFWDDRVFLWLDLPLLNMISSWDTRSEWNADDWLGTLGKGPFQILDACKNFPTGLKPSFMGLLNPLPSSHHQNLNPHLSSWTREPRTSWWCRRCPRWRRPSSSWRRAAPGTSSATSARLAGAGCSSASAATRPEQFLRAKKATNERRRLRSVQPVTTQRWLEARRQWGLGWNVKMFELWDASSIEGGRGWRSSDPHLF